MAALPITSIIMIIYVIGHEMLNLETLREAHPQCGTARFEYMLAPGEISI
jgi:hypothetical protein